MSMLEKRKEWPPAPCAELEGKILELQHNQLSEPARRSGWTAPAPKHTRGVLAKYARLVGSSAGGAVCD